ncbi:hypothetical protein DNH61_19895 [Paenibacillus sambharensis]|uniref:Uncharacterized protein n=1 Tax=Paenibacillus sambharensis TaxID=1803190 RepID=A0A2W1LS17_9BACL|nr:hypothetical protein [Paenibacillus sambharensis]PZD94247.1 hypothetical protein DNH61_19895 [Paenibacillus sambharensis]
MDVKVRRYYELKQEIKQLSEEMAGLREELIGYCMKKEIRQLEAGGCKLKLVVQQRREYDDAKLLSALPDPELWRMLSRADTAKVASLVKLNVLTEEQIKDAYITKDVQLLQVEKK